MVENCVMVFDEVTNEKSGYFLKKLKQRITRVVKRSQEPSELYRNGEYNFPSCFLFFWSSSITYVSVIRRN